MKVMATPIIARDLVPGDLFSTAGPEYWNGIDVLGSIGERVYIRTNVPVDSVPDSDEQVFKIWIMKEKE